jgi:transcriptional regulator with XRE-family HTH domain
LVDCTTETLARTERAESMPRTDTLERLAEVLGLSLADLLGGGAAPRAAPAVPELRALMNELQDLPRADLRAILAVVRLAAKGARAGEPAARSRRKGSPRE